MEPAPYPTSRGSRFSCRHHHYHYHYRQHRYRRLHCRHRRRHRLHRSRLAYSSFMHHENSHVPQVQRGKKRKEKEKERNVCTRKGRVSRTRYVLWSRNAGSTWSPYFRLTSVMRNTNPRVIKMPGGGCCPYTTMSRLLIEIMSSVHLHTFHRFAHPTTFPLCAIKRPLRFALLDGTNN